MEDYRVIRCIGKGSFGKVYLVRHERERKQYVMKVIRLRGIPKKERDACFNEVALMKQLQHPAIVAYKDSFSAKGGEQLCIVMTYCDGGDLQGRITKARARLFKEDQIMHWFVQMALGIHFMHANKVLHRDIKAQNIFMLGNGRLVLGDLGISKVLDGTMGFASTQIGTPYYMSPELFKNKPYNHKSDVWAMGCVLYELSTLKHAFDAGSINGLASKIMRGSYAQIHHKYSRSLRKLISDCLAVNPSSRPSVADMLTTPYMKKHIYNFVKDIAERSSSIGEGTAMFKAAAVQVAGAGAAGGGFRAMLGVDPSTKALYEQLRTLGLQAVVAKALSPSDMPEPEAVPVAVVAQARKDPRVAKRVIRERANALSREEERRRAVQEALERLRKEKEVRARQREQLRKRAAKRAGAGGDPRLRLAEQRRIAAQRRAKGPAPKVKYSGRPARPAFPGRADPRRGGGGGGGGGGSGSGSSAAAGRAGSRRSSGSGGSGGSGNASGGGGAPRRRNSVERRHVADLDAWDREQKRRDDAKRREVEDKQRREREHMAARARDELREAERRRAAAMEAERQRKLDAERQQREAARDRERQKLEALKLERAQRERREREARAAQREAERAAADAARREANQRAAADAARYGSGSDPEQAAREAAEREAFRMREQALERREREERHLDRGSGSGSGTNSVPPAKALPSLADPPVATRHRSAGGLRQLPPQHSQLERQTTADSTKSSGGPVVRDPFKRGTSHGMLPRRQRSDAGPPPSRHSRLSDATPRSGRSESPGRRTRYSASGDEIVVDAGLPPGVSRREFEGMSARDRVLARKMAAKAAEEERQRLQLAAAAQAAKRDREVAAAKNAEQYRGHGAASASAIGAVPSPRSPRRAQSSAGSPEDVARNSGGAGGGGVGSGGAPRVMGMKLPGSRYDSLDVEEDDGLDSAQVQYSLGRGDDGPPSARGLSRSPRLASVPGAGADSGVEGRYDYDDVAPTRDGVDDLHDDVGGGGGGDDDDDDDDDDVDEFQDFESSDSDLPTEEDPTPSARRARDKKPALGPGEDDEEIDNEEVALQAELARSTMRCSDLRATLEAARKAIGMEARATAAAGTLDEASEEDDDDDDDVYDDDAFFSEGLERGGAALEVPASAVTDPKPPDWKPLQPPAAAHAAPRAAAPSAAAPVGGRLQERIRDATRACIGALGEDLFHDVYDRLRVRMWEVEAGPPLQVGGEAYDDGRDDADRAVALAEDLLPPHLAHWGERIQELLHMEASY